MLTINATAAFHKDRRRCIKRGYNMSLLVAAVNTLCIPAPLPLHNHDHSLTGNWAGHQECHLAPDWLLIYRIEGDCLMLYRTGSHSGLFG